MNLYNCYMVSVDVYIDVMDTLSSFQHVDWIRELTADLHSILMKFVIQSVRHT